MYVWASTKEKRVFMFRMRCKMTSCHISRPLCVRVCAAIRRGLVCTCVRSTMRVCMCVTLKLSGPSICTSSLVLRPCVLCSSSLRPLHSANKGRPHGEKRQQLLDNRTFYLNFTHPHSAEKKIQHSGKVLSRE